jgi:hypothetical protein
VRTHPDHAKCTDLPRVARRKVRHIAAACRLRANVGTGPTPLRGPLQIGGRQERIRASAPSSKTGCRRSGTPSPLPSSTGSRRRAATRLRRATPPARCSPFSRYIVRAAVLGPQDLDFSLAAVDPLNARARRTAVSRRLGAQPKNGAPPGCTDPRFRAFRRHRTTGSTLKSAIGRTLSVDSSDSSPPSRTRCKPALTWDNRSGPVLISPLRGPPRGHRVAYPCGRVDALQPGVRAHPEALNA